MLCHITTKLSLIIKIGGEKIVKNLIFKIQNIVQKKHLKPNKANQASLIQRACNKPKVEIKNLSFMDKML
jgi:hypothetical protein